MPIIKETRVGAYAVIIKDDKIAINCYLKCNYKINGIFITKDTQGTNKEYVLMINKP